ncbi:MAG: sigma-70 family RNA polymerase sigma factor [Deltaproteobacteria bacterium]|nr:sigma-70 family RNA polymerase sigma factor [Deltaproteobacteria bacterium]
MRPTVQSLHAAHGTFVWRALFRLGVRADDLEDMLQEVFVVVHRRLDSFDPSGAQTTWIFGICLRIASDYRRRRRRKPEAELSQKLAETLTTHEASPEEHAIAAQTTITLEDALDALDDDKRAVFVLFELEHMSCEAIATLMNIKLGTVHSRLHAARAALRAALEPTALHTAGDARRGPPA